jgi:hypothetical protein
MEKTKERSITEKIRICDFCKKTQTRRRCSGCKKDMCRECIASYDDEYSDDYPDYYCERCTKIRETYKPKINKIKAKIDKLEDEIESIAKECKRECSLKD